MFKDGDYKAKYRWSEKLQTKEKNSRLFGRREELEWIKRQIEYQNFAETYKLQYNLKRGEIYEFDWGINVNAEFSNRHYGVVLVDSDENNPLVTVIPLKTNKHGANPKSDIDLGIVKELSTTVSSLAVINQVRTMDKLRIYTKHVIGNGDVTLSDSEYYNEAPKIEDHKMQILIAAVRNYIMSNGALI